jgi:hypothetical protein
MSAPAGSAGPRTVTFGDPTSTTSEERTNIAMFVRAIMIFMGAGTALAIVYIGLSGLYYAWIFGGGFRIMSAMAVAWLSATFICAGAPVIAGLTWGYRPLAAKIAVILWAVCVLSLAVLDGRAAMHQQSAGAAVAQEATVPEAEAPADDDLGLQIAEAKNALAELAETQARRPLNVWERESKAHWQARLNQTLREGTIGGMILSMFQSEPQAIIPAAPVPPARAGLDAALLTVLMLFICSTGLALSVAGLDSVYTAKARQLAVASSAPATLSQGAGQSAESTDGFLPWVKNRIMVPAKDQFNFSAAYQDYCAVSSSNGFAKQLSQKGFADKLAEYMQVWGIQSFPSNGNTIYRGAKLRQG